MKRKRVFGFSIALFLILFLAIGGTTATQAQREGGLSIGLQLNADGSWQVVELFGQATNLTPQSFNGLARLLGLGFEIPTQLVDPAMVGMLQQAGIDQVTLSLEGEAARVRLNDLASPQAKVYLKSIEPLLGESIGPSYDFLLEILKFVQGTVFVRLTPEAMAVAPPSEAMMAEGDVANNLALGATVDSQGGILSVGGFTRDELEPVLSTAGITLPNLDATTMTYLSSFGTVSVDVAPDHLMLQAGEQPVLELVWDAAGRAATVDLVEAVAGFQLDRQLLDVAEPWIQSSHISVTIHVADAPQEDLLTLQFGEPITVAFEDSGALNVAGTSVPLAGLDANLIRSTIQAYGIQQAQVCWQGTDLRWLVNGMPMPYLSADAGWLTQATRLLGWQVFPLHEKLDQVLANTELPLAVALDPASVPAGDCGAYEATMSAAEPSMSFAIQGTWDRQQNKLDLEEVDLPFDALGMLPIGISMQFELPSEAAIFVPAGLDSVSANLGPNGLTATVNAVDFGLHWDSQLISNLADVADGLGAGATIRQMAPVLEMTEISVDLEAVEGTSETSEAAPEKASEAVATITVETTAIEPAAARSQPAASSVTSQTGAQAKATTSRTTTCVVAKGESLWTCWEELGRTEGTGLVWVDWKEAAMRAYGLSANERGVVIVQPGATIALADAAAN